MTQLLIRPPFGEQRNETIQTDAISIGRAPGNDIYINDPSVSRVHARVHRNGEAFEIVDQGSRNGVLVNDQRIEAPTPIAPGDRILLGDVELELVEGSSESQRIRMSDATFELSPESTTVLQRNEIPADLTTFQMSATDSPTTKLDPGKLLTFFEEVTQAVVEQRPVDDVLDEIVRQCLAIFDETDRACSIIVEDGELSPRGARHRDGREVEMELSQTIVRQVFETHASVLSFNAQEDRRFSATESVFIQGICSVMCVPLLIEEKVIGLLYVDTLSPLKRFDTDQLRLFSALGNIAAGHLQRQRLLSEMIQRQILDEQVKAAAQTQERLLRVELPIHPGYDFHVANQPCLAVGGDYVDIFQVEDTVLLVVADVSGKGIAAAILMATLKAAVHAEARASHDVLEITKRVNGFVYEHTEPEKFATLFLGRLDPTSGRIDYVNAGHDRPVICRAGNATPQRLESTGVMVGAFPEPPMEAGSMVLGPGDFLAMYTDGLHEVQSPGGDEFGEDRLVEWIAAHCQVELDSFARDLVSDVLTFASGVEQQDDMTQLLVRRDAG